MHGVRVRTVVGEDVPQHELLGEAQAAAGRRVVGVRDPASPERRRELCFGSDDLRPQPLEFLGRRVVVGGGGGIGGGVATATEHEVVEQEAIGMFCSWRTRSCCSAATLSTSRNGQKRHGKMVTQSGGISQCDPNELESTR